MQLKRMLPWLIAGIIGLGLVACSDKPAKQEEVVKETLNPAGKVAALKGTVVVVREGQEIPLKVDDTLQEADVIMAKGDSHVRIALQDGSVVAIGNDAQFSIREFMYEAEKQKGNSDLYFEKGAFEVVTGKIGKAAPESFKLQAQTATMGIRGTHIVGEIRDVDDIIIACVEGAIEVNEKTLMKEPKVVPAGKIIYIRSEIKQTQAKEIIPAEPKEFDFKEVVPILIQTGHEVDEVEETVKQLLKVLSSVPVVKRQGDRFIVELGINQQPGVHYSVTGQDKGLGHLSIDRRSGTLKIQPSDVVIGDFRFSARASGATGEEKKTYRVHLEKNREWDAIEAGEEVVIGLKTDGTMWGWGTNQYGELGDGTAEERKKPVEIGQGHHWQQVSIGDYHVLAVDEDGSLWAWGRNHHGQLGEGSLQAQLSPVLVDKGPWKAVSAGFGHSLAIKGDGTLWAWGYNSAGKVGDGTAFDRAYPFEISEDTDWRMISAGDHHNLALKEDGTLWAWGRNSFGQIGAQERLVAPEPTRIGKERDWNFVSAGIGTSFAIKKDGTLWAWGKNLQGQLGDGSTTDRLVPTPVAKGKTWSKVFGGFEHTVALDASGALWAWGSNEHDQIMDGNTPRYTKPVKLADSDDYHGILAGPQFTMAIKKDRTFFALGNVNRYTVETLVVSVFALNEEPKPAEVTKEEKPGS